MAISDTVALNVARFRSARGMTQEELAKAANISRSHLAKIEAGAFQGPGVDTLDGLAKALDVPVALLVSPANPDNPNHGGAE